MATASPVPARGTLVGYQLTATDVSEIITRRLAASAFGAGFVGNPPTEGDQVAALVVHSTADAVNLQVFCDGNDQLWRTSVPPGDQPGQYQAG